MHVVNWPAGATAIPGERKAPVMQHIDVGEHDFDEFLSESPLEAAPPPSLSFDADLLREHVVVATHQRRRRNPFRRWRREPYVIVLCAIAGAQALYIGAQLLGERTASTLPAQAPAAASELAVRRGDRVLPAAPAIHVPPAAGTAHPETGVRPAASPPSHQPSPRATNGGPREVTQQDMPRVDPPGWAALELPVQVHVYEGGRFVGTNAGLVALPAGVHELELVNEGLGFRWRQSVHVRSGSVTTIQVPMPSGTLSVNALPWSDVFIGGRPIGPTPVGAIELPIGTHRVVFRHPQLGEETRTAIVRAGTETRVTVDFRR